MTEQARLEDLPEAELRRRLREAEETIRAIREGDADAVVVRGASEDTVFALAGGDESYRAIMESIDTGAVALDAGQRVVYANTAMCELLDCDAGELQSDTLYAQLQPASADILKVAIAHAKVGRHQVQFVEKRGDSHRHFVVTAAPLPMDFGAGTVLTFTDVTDRPAGAAADESERLGRAVLASANEAVIVCNRNGLITNANSAATAIVGGDPIGQQFDEALPLTFPIGSAIMHSEELIRIAADGSEIKGLEATTTLASPQRDLLVSVAPLRLAGDVIGGSVITLIDLSERKAIEKRQSLLMRELDHRVKNILTMVLSIGSRTIAGSADLADFKHRFTRRIHALAATHNLLADASWGGLKLGAVIRAELAPYLSQSGPFLEMENVDRSVSPDVAIAFGLVVHELATNAVKYGALSCETGKVSIVGTAKGEGLFEIVWTETGGPSVAPGSREGFGQTLITRSLNRGDGTGAMVEFAPEGVICRMVLPVEDA